MLALGGKGDVISFTTITSVLNPVCAGERS